MELEKRRIVVGVGGGIAAYKSCELVRRLRDAGAEVRVVMTAAATRFVSALTFQALSAHPVARDIWDESIQNGMGHLELAHWAQDVLIVPATADLMAQLAHGHAAELLPTLCLATTAPITLAPAMNHRMWLHSATQANVRTLQARGVRILGPADGPLAEGESGPGRLLEPLEIVAQLRARAHKPWLAGQRVLVTAGPTYEDIDPVRFIANRSSGKMGFAVARAAQAAGADVTMIAGPAVLPTPAGVERVDVRSAEEMLAQVMQHVAHATLFIAAAAVGDYRSRHYHAHKIKKSRMQDDARFDLRENPDILATVAALEHAPFTVGFAAETEQLQKHANDKLERKRINMIAANEVGNGKGFETTHNRLVLYWQNGSCDLGYADKNCLAARMLQKVVEHMQGNIRA